jgi:hypothetical protein
MESLVFSCELSQKSKAVRNEIGGSFVAEQRVCSFFIKEAILMKYRDIKKGMKQWG